MGRQRARSEPMGQTGDKDEQRPEPSDASIGRPCPGCSARMQLQRRSAMTRCGGLLLVYIAVAFLLIRLPRLTVVEIIISAALGGTGWELAKSREGWWCPECGREQPPNGKQ